MRGCIILPIGKKLNHKRRQQILVINFPESVKTASDVLVPSTDSTIYNDSSQLESATFAIYFRMNQIEINYLISSVKKRLLGPVQ